MTDQPRLDAEGKYVITDDTARTRLTRLLRRCELSGLEHTADIIREAITLMGERCVCQTPPDCTPPAIFCDGGEREARARQAIYDDWKAHDPYRIPEGAAGCQRSRRYWHGLTDGIQTAASHLPTPLPADLTIPAWCPKCPQQLTQIHRFESPESSYVRAVCMACGTVAYDSSEAPKEPSE